MLLEHERNYGFGMDALVTVCSWNTNGIMVLAWMLWSPYALGTRTVTELWFWHGCSGHRMLLEHERNYGFGMDALVTVCSWNTNGIMVLAWMLWSPYALGTRTELCFGHGCSGHRMLLEHERNYGFGMDALVTVCSWNTNGIMVLAWMLWSPYALGTRTELWFWHGCSGHRMLLEHERHYGFGMDALVTVCSWNTNGIMVLAWMLWSPYALGTRTELWFLAWMLWSPYALTEVWFFSVCSWNTNGIMVLAWMLWSPYALGTRTELWFWHGCSGHRMLLEHERNYGFGMDALVTVCSWNTNGIMVLAWMLWSPYALGTRTELWFWHGCSGHRMLLEHERNYGFGMDALVTVCSWNTNGIMVLAWMLRSPYALGTRTELWFWHGCVTVCSWNTNGIMVLAWMLWSPYALGTRTELWFWHGCSGHRMLLEHERNYGFGMDALVTVCSWNMNRIIVLAWMLWSPCALATRTDLWFWHGCSGHRMLLEHERNYGFGMDALVTVCSRNTNGSMVLAWMLWSPYALGTRTELWFWHGCSGHRMLLEHERNYGFGMDALVTVCSWNTNGSMLWAWITIP